MFAKDRFDIDIVITESILPDIDAFEMLIKFEYLNSDVPIIILTKSEDGEIMDRAISRCINEFFIKPINPNQLIIAIKRILYTSKIRLNRIGKKYSEFSTELNQLLSSNPCYDKWTEIYYKMCKWDLILDDVNDENLKQTHFLEKRNCNSFFSNFIDENYYKWINSNTGPTLSYDIVSKYVIPQLEDNKTVYFIVIDCMRYDQYLSMEPLIKKLFDVKSNLYYSILPTATPYSRNSLFSGLLPEDIAKRFPEYWCDNNDFENSRNRNEHQLLDEQLEDLGQTINPPSKYIKIYNTEESNYVLRKIDSYKNERLVVLVYNFLDLITHNRSRDPFLQEIIPDEEAFRSYTKHWFKYSALYKAIKQISKQENSVLIITTDHGSIKVNRATQVIGDRNTAVTIRYKEGKNLSCSDKHVSFLKNPRDYGLPYKTIVDNYIFAKDDYYFVYPNTYHHCLKQFNGSFQHGGISMEEMIIPVSVCEPKK